MKAKLLNHSTDSNTGMYHLSSSDGILDRLKRFPSNKIYDAKQAHLYGDKKVYKLYNEEGNLDYFIEDDLEIL